ncbi:glycosyltransferase family 61 protein [Rufibacter tibetensis]|uniref:Glycosyltransferase 61 catalytic domain-containing protein n=1 Tax=Rufibacter tibetensis TaxID=512763 RepID=A0A0P0CDB5_9BACT|nr:glycosyltransferase family 61 protein [Rufibacter tibetensis]ALI99763.1 hypothetical protein DC20_13250 [Rufibacter tibetensis]
MAVLLKNLIKKVFPETILKTLYTQYITFKRSQIDTIFFPEYFLQDERFLVKHDEYPFRLTPVKKKHLDTRLQKQYTENEDWTQDEYLLVINEPCLIEPEQGWALTKTNKLIYPSLGFGRAPYVPKPSFFKLHKSKEVKYFKEIISLRDTGEKNYFHFYNDIIPKLFFLREKVGISDQVPVLVSRVLYESKYFQYFFTRSFLQKLTWVIQDDFYIESQKTYFCKPLTHTKKYFNRFLEFAPDLTTEPAGNDRIFITRSRTSTRFIENKEEVEALCKTFGFEVVDFEGMPLEEQMRTFARARFAIGVHGAGLTNMIYRRSKPMSLLEIFPPGEYFPFHYILLATLYGYHYDGFIGEKGTTKFLPGFYLNLEKFENKLKSFVAS